MNNFSTVTSIISALGSSPIDRLKRSWDPISPKIIATLESMRKLMSYDRNYSEYREALHQAVPPCIPFFGGSQTTSQAVRGGLKLLRDQN